VAKLAVSIDDYLMDCRSRGLSVKSIDDNYAYALRERFLPWALSEGIEELDQVTNRVLLRWQDMLLHQPGRRGKPISRFSVRGWVRSLNTFLRWASKNGDMDHEATVEPASAPKILMDVLSRAEIDAMESVAQTERDKLIIRILADTGLRASELLGLKASDLVQAPDRGWYIRVYGKGAKERDIPVPRLASRIMRFARGRQGRIFVALRKWRGEYQPLTLSGLQKLVRHHAKEAGITKRVHPHTLRHSFGTYANGKGENVITIAKIMGHSSLSMQMTYAHLSNRDSFDAMSRLME
jgi:integrase/recombinase XerD